MEKKTTEIRELLHCAKIGFLQLTLADIFFFLNIFTFIFSDAENLHVLVSTRHLGCLTDGMTRPPHFPYPRVLTLPFFGPFFPNLHLKAQHVSCILIFF